MKVDLTLLIIIVSIVGFSCQKDDYTYKQENDTIRYISFDPNVVVVKDKPYELEINGDKDTDIYFKVEQWEQTSRNNLYSSFSCRISSLQDNIFITWGAQGSSFKYYIEYGNKISSGRFMFEGGITVTGREFGTTRGVWNLEERSEGYIGIKTETNEGAFYGWIHLSVTDSSMIIKECAVSKIIDEPIIVGKKP